MRLIARRRFEAADQAAFAMFSGDYNPMHMDRLAARRTQAGAPVVHGVHTLLWALDRLAAAGLPLAEISTVAVQFSKFVYVDEMVALTLTRHDDRSATAEITRDGLVMSTIAVRFGPRSQSPVQRELLTTRNVGTAETTPDCPTIEDMAAMSGWIPPVSGSDTAGQIAPILLGSLGLARIRGIGLLSRLVGMICPGLHSIFTGIRIDLTSDTPDRTGVGFTVATLDPRFHVARIKVAGDGLVGTITAAVRAAPVEPPSIAALASHVGPGRFAGSSALIVGGSRGLGALTAKLLATGGARVVVTYATGEADAAALSQELNAAFGAGTCQTMRLDVLEDVRPQLGTLPAGIDRLYYFATTRIYRAKRALFDPAQFAEFNRVYVEAFHLLCLYLLESGAPLTAFYPSTVFVTERPEQMTEYAMSKAAGELLCADMARQIPALQVVVERLPRMLTDQTATISPLEMADPLTVMLPLIARVQA